MNRKHIFTPILALLLLMLAACGESSPKKVDGPGSEFVVASEMSGSLYDYVGLRCVEGFQPFDVDSASSDYETQGMDITVKSHGEVLSYKDSDGEKQSFYAQDWVRLKTSLRKDIELPVVIIHSVGSSLGNADDQIIVPQIGAGGSVDMRLVTENYAGGGASRITGMTLCLKVGGREA